MTWSEETITLGHILLGDAQNNFIFTNNFIGFDIWVCCLSSTIGF